MKSFEEFESNVIYKGFDIDMSYGFQCWDLFAQYCLYLGYPIINTTPRSQGGSGYAKDLYNFRTTNGILKTFKLIKANEEPHRGDVVIFGESVPYTPLSHVGIVANKTSTKLLVLGQNQGGKPHQKGANYGACSNETWLPRSAVLGYFRPLMFTAKPKPKQTNLNVEELNKVPTQAVKFKNKKMFNPTRSLRVWLAPNTTKAKVYKFNGIEQRYKINKIVIVDYYLYNDGYKWLSWVSSVNNKRHWIRSGKVDKNNKLITKYGTLKDY